MAKNRGPALLIELEQVHDCCAVAVSDRMNDSKIKWLATIGRDRGYITNLFEIVSSKPKEFIDHLKTHKTVGEIKVISSDGKRAMITMQTRIAVSTAIHLQKSGTSWIEPTWTEGGVDHVTMFAPDFKSFKRFLESVEGEYDVKIKAKKYIDPSTRLSLDSFRSAGFLQLKTASELLTDKQMEAFDTACRYGYYENPKKVTLDELAQKLGTSEAALSELLRKAEKKLLPILSEIIRAIR